MQAKTLEELASEALDACLVEVPSQVQNGSARLMLDATTHKKLVRVVDVVLLRLYSSQAKDVHLSACLEPVAPMILASVDVQV